jgi:hydrogenase maturation protease
MTVQAGTVVVFGLGNADRGDDGVGPEVAGRLVGRVLPGVRVVSPAEPVDLLDDGDTADLVVVVDAVRSGRPPGTLMVRDANREPLPSWTGSGGTHALGLDAAVELLRALGRMPHQLVLVGVEAADFRPGAPLSPAVRQAVPAAVGLVVAVAGSMVGGEP